MHVYGLFRAIEWLWCAICTYRSGYIVLNITDFSQHTHTQTQAHTHTHTSAITYSIIMAK